MPDKPKYPGVYVEEQPPGRRAIAGAATSITAFVGRAAEGPLDAPLTVFSFSEFERRFGELGRDYPLGYAVFDFFINGGSQAVIARLQAHDADGQGDEGYLAVPDYLGEAGHGPGLRLLDRRDLFNLLCIPPDQPGPDQDLDPLVRHAAAQYCADRRAMYIADPPARWARLAKEGNINAIDPADLGITGANAAGVEVARNAAVYFPRLVREDPTDPGRTLVTPPCGAIAGIYAATDAARGVWKAPAGIEAGIAGISGLEVGLTDAQNGVLNPEAINALRLFPTIGPVVWGARTLAGRDALASDYKYVPVRRLALYLEESIDRGTRWAVFEPNDANLWARLRDSVDAFLRGLQRQGAFYDCFVKCDASTMTQNDLDQGIVTILIGFAPLKPAEFVTLTIRQSAGRGN